MPDFETKPLSMRPVPLAGGRDAVVLLGVEWLRGLKEERAAERRSVPPRASEPARKGAR